MPSLKGKSMESNGPSRQPSLAALRQKLAAQAGRRVWSGFEELAETREFQELLEHEFPRQASAIPNLNRRDFIKLLAAPLALAGLSACIPQPPEKIMPYSEAPEGLTPGEPMFFATAMERDGYGRGLVVKSTMGRPIKAEGNPQHPASLGATDRFAQASLLDLYDPDRAQVISSQGRIRSYDEFLSVFTQARAAQDGIQGAGLRILTGTVTSPTLAAQIQSLLDQLPRAKWHQYMPVNRDNVWAGVNLAFGEDVSIQYHFENADVILSLDGDFTLREPGDLRYIHDFTAKRDVRENQTEMNRLYVVESEVSNAGAIADHRLALQAGQIEGFARLVANQLGLQLDAPDQVEGVPNGWVDAVVSDLNDHMGTSLVLAGPQQPAAVHALAQAINFILNNVNNTVTYTEPVEAKPVNQTNSLRELVRDLDNQQVDVLVVLGNNPVYTAPVDLNFKESIQKANLIVYLGLYEDETAALADWHIPAAHYLETWSDILAYDGTASILQPLIEPLYQGKSDHELLAALMGQPNANGYDLVRQYWQNQIGSENFEAIWNQSLLEGVMPNTALATKEVALQEDFTASIGPWRPPPTGEDVLEMVFEPDPSAWDGRFCNNSWLQELPKPLTKLTWDNAVLIAPASAERLGISNQDVVELRYQGTSISAPVWILPGLPKGTAILPLGYGRQRGGDVLAGLGFNAYALRTSQNPWFGYGLEIQKTGRQHILATTQHHHRMEGRELVQVAPIEKFREEPDFLHTSSEGENPSLYPEFKYDGHKWGMSINLNTCIGCNYCVIACQAENNIPPVGKEQVLNKREMHWIRLDRYFEGNLDQPDILFEPVPCMQCENAPCEPVCPVEATVHDEEGLNEMIYNRCVGTRYCSNNCPYKVRRFNFLQFSDLETVPLELVRNPDVTVRFRGVMEKCTYCIQRINRQRIEAEVEGRPIQDGEIKTACQQVCPANAIIFGDINDPESQVKALKEQPHNYTLLEDVNTRPRTTYLAKFRNRNPMIEEMT
jgi:MoCo/4Fe-4S cofactor protein with predicted Tat translocation signal